MGVAPLPPLRWKVKAGAFAAVPLLRDMLNRPDVTLAAELTVRLLVALVPSVASPLAVRAPVDGQYFGLTACSCGPPLLH